MTTQYPYAELKIGDEYSAVRVISDPIEFPNGSIPKAQVREASTLDLAIEVAAAYSNGVLTIGPISAIETATLSASSDYVLEAQLSKADGTGTKTQATGRLFVKADYCFSESSSFTSFSFGDVSALFSDPTLVFGSP